MVMLLQPPPSDPPADEPGARPQKSSAAFRTISEVADDLDVAQHVLRFWESKFPQVRPLKRGGGRRYYRPEDVELLRQIRSLLYEEGYTIKGAQKLLRGRRPRGGAGDPPPTAAAPPAPRVAPAAGVGRAVAPEARQRLKGVRDELKEIRELLARARAELP
jgi:DNA-binding transcriptional MerR regulator